MAAMSAPASTGHTRPVAGSCRKLTSVELLVVCSTPQRLRCGVPASHNAHSRFSLSAEPTSVSRHSRSPLMRLVPPRRRGRSPRWSADDAAHSAAPPARRAVSRPRGPRRAKEAPAVARTTGRLACPPFDAFRLCSSQVAGHRPGPDGSRDDTRVDCGRGIRKPARLKGAVHHQSSKGARCQWGRALARCAGGSLLADGAADRACRAPSSRALRLDRFVEAVRTLSDNPLPENVERYLIASRALEEPVREEAAPTSRDETKGWA